MSNRWTTLTVCIVVLALCGYAVACGDDTSTGPMFGDLQFTPSFDSIGSGRTIQLSLQNTASAALGPVLLGRGDVSRVTMADSLCQAFRVNLAPSSVSTLGPGETSDIEVVIDDADVDVTLCPPQRYDADVLASVDGRVLARATIRFRWDGP